VVAAPTRRHQVSRRWIFVAAGLVALVVLLIGGYVAHWAWTGFSDNDTLWDWLQLLLLPAIIAGLPLWLAHGDFMERRTRVLAACVVVAFVALVVLGYAIPWNWTGFPGNKLWDWVGLILLPLVVASIRLWPEIRRRFAPRHAVAFTALVSALVALVLVGYLRPWTWTGFTGNTLWDWIQLLAVPLLVPTVVVPAAVAYMAVGVEERELEAGVKTVEPESRAARPPRRSTRLPARHAHRPPPPPLARPSSRPPRASPCSSEASWAHSPSAMTAAPRPRPPPRSARPRPRRAHRVRAPPGPR
jgi:hypothetical protein